MDPPHRSWSPGYDAHGKKLVGTERAAFPAGYADPGPSMVADTPAPPRSKVPPPKQISASEMLLRILAGLHDAPSPLPYEQWIDLHNCLAEFIDTVNPMLPDDFKFIPVMDAKGVGAVQPAGRTATISQQTKTPKPKTPAPPKGPGPKSKPAPVTPRPSYAEKAKPKASPPLKHLQQGTKASHLVLRPYITTKDRNSAKSIRDECERLEFIQDDTLSITEVVWTMHGDLRIATKQPITPDQSRDLIAAVAKYSAKGQAPAVQNRPTVSTLNCRNIDRKSIYTSP
jgi:hypothetical protein